MSHWTNEKIRRHLLTCMIAMTALRLLEIKLHDKYTSKVVMEEMHTLASVITRHQGTKKPELGLEEPVDLQIKILKGHGRCAPRFMGPTNLSEKTLSYSG